MRAIRIGLMGAGTVGCGTLEALAQRGGQIARSLDCTFEVTKILVRDPSKPRPVAVDARLLTTDPQDILADPSIDVVLELIGGEEPARQYIEEALKRGKHVVTANKEVIAKHGYRLLQLAEGEGVNLLYEASVGGGIPVIDVVRRGLVANQITQIEAIINGTTNYILTAMTDQGRTFDEALKQAQQLGYAEADPGNDIEGTDAAYKLAILGTLAFKTNVLPSDIDYSGISNIDINDFRYAREMGYVIKLLAKTRLVDDEVEAWVHPVFIPSSHHLASVKGVYNAVLIDGDRVGTVMLFGRGAGAKPTSSAIVADLCTVAHNLQRGVSDRIDLHDSGHRIKDFGEIESRHYIRMLVADQPGVLAQIGRVMGECGISIAAVIQKETDEAVPSSLAPLVGAGRAHPVPSGRDGEAKAAEIVMMTHPSKERQMVKALKILTTLEVVKGIGSFFRVEK